MCTMYNVHRNKIFQNYSCYRENRIFLNLRLISLLENMSNSFSLKVYRIGVCDMKRYSNQNKNEFWNTLNVYVHNVLSLNTVRAAHAIELIAQPSCAVYCVNPPLGVQHGCEWLEAWRTSGILPLSFSSSSSSPTSTPPPAPTSSPHPFPISPCLPPPLPPPPPTIPPSLSINVQQGRSSSTMSNQLF